MGMDGRETLADVIRQHAKAEADGLEIMSRQVENERLIASRYNVIRAAMERLDVAGLAVVDRSAGLVYVPMPNGTIAHFGMIDSDDVPAADEVADGYASHINLGEAS